MTRMPRNPVWKFETAHLTVTLNIIREYGYKYDGDDEDGETQRKLDSGEYVAFDSEVAVWVNGEIIARDTLGGSVYEATRVAEFWTAHRDPDPMERNSSLMRAKRGANVCICHYFPGMVQQACKEARQYLAEFPRLRPYEDVLAAVRDAMVRG